MAAICAFDGYQLKGPRIAPLKPQPAARVEWEEKVCIEMCERGEMTHGDACGITEIYPDDMNDMYAAGTDPTTVAQRLLSARSES